MRIAILVSVLVAVGTQAARAGALPTETHSPPQKASSNDETLPARVHQLANGRYVMDGCDMKRRRHCQFQYLLPKDWKPGQAIHLETGGSGMAPSDVQSAYSLPDASSAGGKIVAIIDAPDTNAFSDLAAYRAGFGIPPLPECIGLPTGTTPCFAQLAEDGGPSSGEDNDAGGDGETGLDMDMISAACPDCTILLIEINQNLCSTDILMGVQTAARLGASAISISMGGPETSDPAFFNIDAGLPDVCPAENGWVTDPTGYTTPGHLVFASAGDFGFNGEATCKGGDCGSSAADKAIIPESPSYPSSAPDVIAVGGTTLTESGGAYTEVVWNNGRLAQDVTTSGCSTEFDAVPWQTALLSGTDCTKRATADISAAAYFNGANGGGIACYAGGHWAQVMGTSASSPMVAAMFTRFDLTSITSQYISWPYSNASAFNDVTSGTDDVDSQCTAENGILCTAGVGWDGPSGVGTPNGEKLAALGTGTTPPYPTPPPVGPTIGSLDGGGDATVTPPPLADASASPDGDSGTTAGDSGEPATDHTSGKGGCNVTGGSSSGTSGVGIVGVLLGLGIAGSRRRRSA